MSLLSQVTKGKIRQPILIVVYGPDGVGKSTLGASAPDPIFLGAEHGTANLDVARLPAPKTIKDVFQSIDELTTEKHDFKTLVIDSLDWLEPLVWEQVCIDNNWKTIEDPGYGKGFTIAMKYWQTMLGKLTRLRENRGMNIILIAHSQAKLAKDPQNQTEYDRYQLKLNDRAAALWREYVDAVLFANFEVLTHKDKGKIRAFGDGVRFLYTERRPGFDAKNRFGLPFQIPLSWEDFMDAYQSGAPEDPETVIQNIKELAEMIEDAEVKDKTLSHLEKAGHNIEQLETLQNRLRGYVGAA